MDCGHEICECVWKNNTLRLVFEGFRRTQLFERLTSTASEHIKKTKQKKKSPNEADAWRAQVYQKDESERAFRTFVVT